MFLYDDDMLLAKIAQRDEQAFSYFYNRFKDKVYTYAMRLCQNPDDAEDIVHNVFLNIWIRESTEPIQHLESYIQKATVNTCLKFIRTKKLLQITQKVVIDSYVERHTELEDALLLAESSLLLNKAVDLLPPQQKLIYKLCKEDGLKYSQVAEHLSISPLTVKTHMQHALRFLRGYLLKHGCIVAACTVGYMMH